MKSHHQPTLATTRLGWAVGGNRTIFSADRLDLVGRAKGCYQAVVEHFDDTPAWQIAPPI